MVTRYMCPVCRWDVQPTMRGNIASHLDGARATCPAGGEPWRITIIRRPEYSGVTA